MREMLIAVPDQGLKGVRAEKPTGQDNTNDGIMYTYHIRVPGICFYAVIAHTWWFFSPFYFNAATANREEHFSLYNK